MVPSRRAASMSARCSLLALSLLLTGCEWFTDFKQQPKIVYGTHDAMALPPTTSGQ